MSQYVTVSCKALENVKPAILRKAVKKIDRMLDVKPSSSIEKKALKIDATLYQGKTPTTIGFSFTKKEGGKVGMTVRGEFWHTGFEANSFITDLCKNYTLVQVEDVIKQENQQILSQKVLDDETLEIRVAV